MKLDKTLLIGKNKEMPLKINRSPLRYPGGKTRACKILEKVLLQYFDLYEFENFVSPFFGGGSFEFYIQNKYQLNIIANDAFFPLYNFWKICKIDRHSLYKSIKKHHGQISKIIFKNMQNSIKKDKEELLVLATYYFIINRCSFNGSTLSGGFSKEASKKRFTCNSIEKIANLNLDNFKIYNKDFKEFINDNTCEKNFIFLDPPYFLNEKSKLYGFQGDLHKSFCHEKLYELISKKKNWVMTYNNCPIIKNLYKEFLIIETNWSYGMNKDKKSSEIIIIGKPALHLSSK